MNPDITVFDTVFSFFGIDISAQNTWFLLASAGAAIALCVILRVLAGLVYYSNISALLLFAKPIEKKSDIKKTPSAVINRCVAEYSACGENGAPLSEVNSIVMKNILKMGFLGINLNALERLCSRLEAVALGTVAAGAVISGQAGWIALMGCVYIICRLLLLFFDLETLRDKLFYGISTYLNREMGKLYIPDDRAGMRVFKNELHSSLMEQASILQNAVNNLNSELSGVIREAYNTMQKTLDTEIKKYDNLGDRLKEPVEKLGVQFDKFDRASSLLENGVKALSESVTQMNGKISIMNGVLEKSGAASLKSVENSELVFHELRDSLKSFGAAYQAIEAELSTVRNTQKALETSLHSYELSLQQTAGQVGDAVGSIVEYRGKEAAEALNEAIKTHVTRFQTDTAGLIEKMAALFEHAYEQNKSEMQTLLRIEELVKK